VTKIIITPFDLTAPGSYRRWKTQVERIGKLADIANVPPAEVVAILEGIERDIIEYGETEDGTPVADALNDISMEQYQALARATLGQETVPNVSDAS